MEIAALYYVRNLLTFRMDLLPQSSTLKTEAVGFREVSKFLPAYKAPRPRRHQLLPWEYRRFFFMAQKPKSSEARLTVEVSRSHTITHTHTHSLSEWSARRRRRYSHKTQQTQETNTHAPREIRTRDPSHQAVPDLRLRPQGHRDGPPKHIQKTNLT